MTRYLRVWGGFLRLTFRRFPVLTTVLLASFTIDMAVPAAIALALRSVVNASADRQASTAVYAAVGFGLVSCLDYLLGHVTSWLRILLVERVGFTDIEQEITESIYGIESIGHLERTDYLDRVTVLRYSTWGLADSLWSTLVAVFSVGQVTLTLVVLGSVSPWLLFLLAFAAAPLWFDSKGRAGVAKAETDSAEDFRLQRHLFEMATSAKAGKEIRLSAAADEVVARQGAAPDGLDTELGSELGGLELSEGQWQKTALARACMRPLPTLLVLDEPTASLDAPSEHAVFQHHMARARATGRAAGTITVIVSHRFSTVAGADLILVMDDGRLVEAGSHDELLAAGGHYAELYGIQSAAYAM